MKNLLLSAAVFALFLSSTASTATANWIDDFRAQQEWRQNIRSTHILHRPYRWGHFYGNTVRQRHHEGKFTIYDRSL